MEELARHHFGGYQMTRGTTPVRGICKTCNWKSRRKSGALEYALREAYSAWVKHANETYAADQKKAERAAKRAQKRKSEKDT